MHMHDPVDATHCQLTARCHIFIPIPHKFRTLPRPRYTAWW